ncbi:two-component response regulator [Staphylococcus devriesei]|nr:two-component response regulator [Staphylococcus devriesei]
MISIVISEDQYMLRKAIIQLIEFNEEMKVIANFENGIDTLEYIRVNRPDVAILDI